LSNSNQIIYDNISGYAVSKGVTLNSDLSFSSGLKFILGATLMENTVNENGISQQQLLTEKMMGTWAVSYKIKPWNLSFDYTGNLFGPMKLPLLNDLDPRKPESPWWSIQNIQFTFDGIKGFEIYGGVKNLLNWTPNKGNPFLIARAHEPFDQNVQFDANGEAIATAENPYALTFDLTYFYPPNQGIRGFLGVRFNLK
jgi:outer membrane receptor for ferrienterochelin and colicins